MLFSSQDHLPQLSLRCHITEAQLYCNRGSIIALLSLSFGGVRNYYYLCTQI